jgi:hypothetical protein
MPSLLLTLQTYLIGENAAMIIWRCWSGETNKPVPVNFKQGVGVIIQQGVEDAIQDGEEIIRRDGEGIIQGVDKESNPEADISPTQSCKATWEGRAGEEDEGICLDETKALVHEWH